jgi:plastocyanin
MKRSWRNIGILGVAALVGVLAVWAGNPWLEAATPGPGEGMGTSPQSGTSVTIQTFQFKPPSLEVKAGTRVIWTNQDDIVHTVTSGTPESRDGRFDSRLDGKGATFSLALTQPGTYTYFCNRHQSMRGEVRVN